MNKNYNKKGANSSYFGDIIESIRTLSGGLWLTLKHIFQATRRRNTAYISDNKYFDQKTGLVTLQYPIESLPVPDNGRYRLHNEIDDCIVCDKCAKICPVDCITIESIKATEEIGKTSDGTSKRLYAPIFDIDLAKCCYCGLCTTVCPTECLTMTKVYDFSEPDVENFIYKFSDMNPEQAAQKKKEAEFAAAQKEAAKSAKAAAAQDTKDVTVNSSTLPEIKPTAKPVFKPKIKSVPSTEEDSVKSGENKVEEVKKEESSSEAKTTPRPVFKPKIKPSPILPKENKEETKDDTSKKDEQPEAKTDVKPVFKPKIKPVQKPVQDSEFTSSELKSEDNQPKIEEDKTNEAKPKPVFRPKIRPIKPSGEKPENQ